MYYQKPIHLKGNITDSQRFPLNLYLINIVEDIVVFPAWTVFIFDNFLHCLFISFIFKGTVMNRTCHSINGGSHEIFLFKCISTCNRSWPSGRRSFPSSFNSSIAFSTELCGSFRRSLNDLDFNLQWEPENHGIKRRH